KSIRIANLTLAIAAFLTVSTLASAQLVLDDFSTGPYQKTLKTGHDTNTQTGKMAGGSRATDYVSCPDAGCAGGGAGDNPFDQPNSFQIKPKTKTTPSALIFNSGYKTYPVLYLSYGYGSPMTIDLSSSYDRIRLNFDGENQVINFNLLVFSSSGYSQTGCNIVAPGYMTPFTIDFPFVDFTSGADFSAVNYMVLEFDVGGGPNMQADFAVTSFEAIPIGAPPADITCPGLGK
ncbi:MAG: hypothetical protein ABSG70_04920, partial [Terriglobales bacterium]